MPLVADLVTLKPDYFTISELKEHPEKFNYNLTYPTLAGVAAGKAGELA